jgi:hypothetical protein
MSGQSGGYGPPYFPRLLGRHRRQGYTVKAARILNQMIERKRQWEQEKS